MTNFEIALREFLKSCPEREITEYFRVTFLDPLTNSLDTDPTIPAEVIRQKRQQTNHVKNILLGLRIK